MTASSSAISDVITVVGSAYFQPIADLIETLLSRPAPAAYPAGTSGRENGYSASIIVLLVALLESYTARLRFTRNGDLETAGKATPELLAEYFPDLPKREELVEVFLLRNLVVHNHIWHLDVSDFEAAGACTLATPKELGFQTNKHYDAVVDVAGRRTRKLGLHASPTSVDRSDAKVVFEVVWNTLTFMKSKSVSDTPLAVCKVGYAGKFRQFDELIQEFSRAQGNPDAP